MAGGESQKQFLALIRNFASEKSQDEHRVSDLRKRFAHLQGELTAANADLEELKESKEAAEQELKGVQFQLSMIDASIQAQEARIGLLQEEILKLRSNVDALKSEEGADRDEFIKAMCELNKKIRHLQEMIANAFLDEHDGPYSKENDKIVSKSEVSDKQEMLKLKGIEDNIAHLKDQMQKLEAEYQKEQHNYSKACEGLAHAERRWFLMSAIMEETKQLQELAERTPELEKVVASLGEDMARKCTCPSCGLNNIEDGAMEGPEAIETS
ncbi:uncharacterized protein LOC122042087 [Zingiber officinale]|uniref:uncharacterized protein LOC122042087 n=1 Tax=Zingiber officinale TaxID=94328 RepID=UPI001C4D05F2|nr:uncharacterized protein LOC122042087 [Zingiber officinale]